MSPFSMFRNKPSSSPGWITNVRDAIEVPMRNPEGDPFTGHRGNSICVTCDKKMPDCWDTVCAKCGDTSCYDHSHEVGQEWRCEKCKDLP